MTFSGSLELESLENASIIRNENKQFPKGIIYDEISKKIN